MMMTSYRFTEAFAHYHNPPSHTSSFALQNMTEIKVGTEENPVYSEDLTIPVVHPLFNRTKILLE